MAQEEKSQGVKSVKFPSTYGNGFEKYINAVYDASNQARVAEIQKAYDKGVADFQAATRRANAAYAEGRRQAAGETQRQNTGYQATADAYGLNSGLSGQAAVAQGNQYRSDLSALGREQETALGRIDMQKQLLRQNLALQRQQAVSENEAQRAGAMYAEKVRMDEIRRQQAQQAEQRRMQYAQMFMAAEAKAAKNAAKTKQTEPSAPIDHETAALYLMDTIADGRYSIPATEQEWEQYSEKMGEEYMGSYKAYLRAFIEDQEERYKRRMQG